METIPHDGETGAAEAMRAGGRGETEGRVAKALEEQTSKLPSDTFLWMAGGSIVASLLLRLSGRKEDALFVGQWAPTFLVLGVYNKIVKTSGHASAER